MNKLRIFRRLKILEWQNEMLLQKIAFVADNSPATKAKIDDLLKNIPRELK